MRTPPHSGGSVDMNRYDFTRDTKCILILLDQTNNSWLLLL